MLDAEKYGEIEVYVPWPGMGSTSEGRAVMLECARARGAFARRMGLPKISPYSKVNCRTRWIKFNGILFRIKLNGILLYLTMRLKNDFGHKQHRAWVKGWISGKPHIKGLP